MGQTFYLKEVLLQVKDLAAVRRIFSEGFGLAETECTEGRAVFGLDGGVILAFSEKEKSVLTLAADPAFGTDAVYVLPFGADLSVSSGERPGNSVLKEITFGVSDVHTALALTEDAGIPGGEITGPDASHGAMHCTYRIENADIDFIQPGSIDGEKDMMLMWLKAKGGDGIFTITLKISGTIEDAAAKLRSIGAVTPFVTPHAGLAQFKDAMDFGVKIVTF